MITAASIWAMLKDLVANDVLKVTGTTAPVDGTSGTGAKLCGPGSMYVDTANKRVYINVGTKASPTWAAINASGASSFFISSELTGTGSSQSTAHGLGVTPTRVMAVPSDTAPATTGAYTMTFGTHTSTNVLTTVTSGKKYYVMAWA